MTPSVHRLCVAPMMDWTDRHCRYFHRLLAPHAMLYTEMVTADALLHGDIARHLDFTRTEHPLALQLGGSEAGGLARCARLGEQWGYDEINLNCGCPSERVQRGSFGACLMAEPDLVAECVRAMQDAVGIPVTVKHRTGIDREEDFSFVAHFVETVARAGCTTFIVHARNAWLHGLSPKENREVPPLRYDFAFRLKREFPELEIVLNGGLTTTAQVENVLTEVDGVMLGRQAYHDPYSLTSFETALWPGSPPPALRAEIVERMIEYARDYLRHDGAKLRHITRHILGLYLGVSGARQWRRALSDSPSLEGNRIDVIRDALRAVEPLVLKSAA